MLKVIELAMNTSDMAGSLRFYSEVFGFRNAGGQCTWGNVIRAQGLPPESRALKWWLVGGQALMHLEFFHHTVPAQRPQPSDWTPRDHGWVRFGLRVGDFDRCIDTLPHWGIRTFTAPQGAPAARRVAFRDPFAGCVVEVIEGNRDATDPDVVYVAASVEDLDPVRIFYSEMLGFAIEPLDGFHPGEDEGLWGLPHATREGFVAVADDVRIEVVRYNDPAGRPKPYSPSDQGFVNIAIGSHDAEAAAAAFDRIKAAGLTVPHLVRGPGLIAGFIADPGREIELAAFPPTLLAPFGFEPHLPFLDQALQR